MLPNDERLTRRRDFAAVYARKRSWADPLVVLYVRKRNDGEMPGAETFRFGFSVSKKVGKAHDRNRVKRRLREICRLHRGEWRGGADLVFVARSGAASANFLELEAAVLRLMRRAGLARTDDSSPKPVAASAITLTSAQPPPEQRV